MQRKKKQQLLTEWEKFKFDKDSWKQEIPEGMNESHLETAMEWYLKWLISLKAAYSTVFPALANMNNNNNNNFINLLKKAFQLNLQCQISKT